VISKICSIFIIVFLSACGGGSSGGDNPSDGVITFDFSTGWESGFSEYPVGGEENYELESGFGQLPAPLESRSGFNVSGNNHSADLFMFIKKRFLGFEPNTLYQLAFEITFATNAPYGCAGVGAAPGEGVSIKAGASVVEPQAYNDGSGFYLLNIDKGAQANSGSDAITLGDFANSKNCEEDDFTYELKTLTNSDNEFSVYSDSDGALWVLFGTDSGFEATTSIYYVAGSVVATKM
jgi:hypothetical protein